MDRLLLLVAHHEAGHAVAGHVLGWRVRSVSIDEDGGGVTYFEGARVDLALPRRVADRGESNDIEPLLIRALAGPIAQCQAEGLPTPGALDRPMWRHDAEKVQWLSAAATLPDVTLRRARLGAVCLLHDHRHRAEAIARALLSGSGHLTSSEFEAVIAKADAVRHEYQATGLRALTPGEVREAEALVSDFNTRVAAWTKAKRHHHRAAM
ncbi:MAG: M50 family metallopeptidase [Gammaproteobacteria bacterium]